MLKGILAGICLLAFAGVAQAEVVVLKSSHVYESTKGEKSFSFSSKACGIKAIAFGFEGKQISWLRYSQAIASYQTESAWGVVRDHFNSYGMIMAGDTTPWFQLRDNAPCLRKIYLQGETSLWPTTEGKIVVYGLK
jgi:hypothetical protein